MGSDVSLGVVFTSEERNIKNFSNLSIPHLLQQSIKNVHLPEVKRLQEEPSNNLVKTFLVERFCHNISIFKVVGEYQLLYSPPTIVKTQVNSRSEQGLSLQELFLCLEVRKDEELVVVRAQLVDRF